jgi:hypothetical protein
MKGVIAIQKLSAMGYCFALKGDQVRYEWNGSGDPDPAQVRPLLAQVKANKPEVVDFLRCFCPRCGGCCFAPDYEGRPQCLACDWAALVELYPDLKLKH